MLVRRPLPGVAPSLPLEDAGKAKPARITLLTTEHDNLQMRRVATISDSNGRAGVVLGAVSAGFIALDFERTRSARTVGRMIFQVLVLTPLVFLDWVAFVRRSAGRHGRPGSWQPGPVMPAGEDRYREGLT